MTLQIEAYKKPLFVCLECRCGFCRDECPIYEQVKVESACAKGRVQMAWAFMEGLIKPSTPLLERLSLCTTCGYCTERCPNNKIPNAEIIDIAEITEAFRADVVRETGPLEIHEKIAKSVKKDFNPLGEPAKDRVRWLLTTGIKPAEKADTLYFVGCMASYRVQETAEATVKLLKKAGMKFTLLKDERCCGSVLIRTGQNAKDFVEYNINAIETLGCERVITACAGCYKTLKLDYPKISGKLPFEVVHISEVLMELIQAKRLRTGKFDGTVTYHDPCHLGRGTKVYEQPRGVIANYAKLVEMELNKEVSKCCGAGGGVRAAWHDISLALARNRVKMAHEVRATALVTSCPFCTYHLKEAGGIDIYDLPVFVAKALHLGRA